MGLQEAISRLTVETVYRNQGGAEALEQTRQLEGAQAKLIGTSEKLQTATGNMEKALLAQQRALQTTKAANDNMVSSWQAANDNMKDVTKTLAEQAAGFLNNINHLKLLALAAYAISPAFRSIVATGVMTTFTAIGIVAPTAATALTSFMRFAAPALSFFARIAGPVAILVTAWTALNYVWKTGADLLDRYGKVGIADFAAKIEALSKDTISAAQAATAGQLATRLAAANAQISNFFTIQFDVTNVALKLQGAWVAIVERIATAATWLNSMSMPAWLGPLLALAAKGLPVVGLPLTVGSELMRGAPADPNAAMNAARNLYTGAVWQKATAEQRADLEKQGYSASFNERFSGAPVPDKPDTSTTSYQRAIQTIKDQIDQLNLEAQGAGKTSQAYQELKVAHTLNLAAMKTGIPVTDEMRAAWKGYADQIAAATVALNQAKVLQEETFKGQTMFMSPSQSAAANAAHQIDPTNWAAHLNDAGPKMAAFNQQLGQARDLSVSFAQDFSHGLQQGQTAWMSFEKAAVNALTRISDKLIEMAVNNLWSAAFPTNSGGGGLLGILFGGTKTSGPDLQGGVWPTARGNAFDRGNIIHPFALGGIPGDILFKPTLFPMANGMGLAGEAGPEAIMPLRRGPDGRLGVAAQGGGGSIAFAPVYNIDARGSQMTEAQFTAILARNNQQVKDDITKSLPDRVAAINRDPRKRG